MFLSTGTRKLAVCGKYVSTKKAPVPLLGTGAFYFGRQTLLAAAVFVAE